MSDYAYVVLAIMLIAVVVVNVLIVRSSRGWVRDAQAEYDRVVAEGERARRQLDEHVNCRCDYTPHYAPNYSGVLDAMQRVRKMPVGPGERFESEEAKAAFLEGMNNGLTRVMHGDVDAQRER